MRLVVLAISFWASGVGWAAVGTCYASPATAAAGTGAGSGRVGYRVEARRFDTMLGRAWIVVANCEHPEWPLTTVLGSSTAVMGRRRAEVDGRVVLADTPVVKIGSRVRLLRLEPEVQVEMAAVAEASGRIGDRVKVQVMRLSTETGSTLMELTGIVRGPGYVEMEP